MPGRMKVTPEFRIYFVNSDNSLVDGVRGQADKPAAREESQGKDEQSPPEGQAPNIAVAATPDAPPPLPAAPSFEISVVSTTAAPPSLPAGSQDAPLSEGSGKGSGEGSSGSSQGASGGNVSPVDVKGCKLFILPPEDHPVTLEAALPLCEGLAREEFPLARTIEFKISLSAAGQPGDIRLARSCGKREIDSAVQDLMQLMRFDTARLKEAPEYYLTMVVVCGK